jgi:hypothetical protein
MTFFKKEDGRQGFLEMLNSKKGITIVIKNKQSWVYIILLGVLIVNVIKFILFGSYIYLNRKKTTYQINYIFLFILLYILLSGPVNCSRLMMPLQLVIIIFGMSVLNEKR